MKKNQVKLKCPKCGKNLSANIDENVNIANAKVRCSDGLCKYVGLGAEFLTESQPPQGNPQPQNTSSDTDVIGTQIYDKSRDIATDMGQIRNLSNGKIYPLHAGINAIGRLAQTYKPNMEPNVKIQTNDMKMSRCHARIDVKNSSEGKGYVFHLQDTSLNGIVRNDKEIPKSDIIVLRFGDQMVWGDTKVIFEAANGTQFGGDDTQIS